MTRSVAVIGAGLIGLATAFELVHAGYGVTVLESAEDVATGASHANGGLLTPSMSDPWNAPGVFRHLMSSVFDPYAAMKLHLDQIPSLSRWGIRFLRYSSEERFLVSMKSNFRLAQYSNLITRSVVPELVGGFDYSGKGTMKVFRENKAMEGLLAASRTLEPLGLKFDVLDRDGAVAAEPQLRAIRDRIAGAILYPDDGSGDANKFCHALEASIRNAGGDIRLGVSVNTIRLARGKFSGLGTSIGVLSFDAAVIANGAESPKLASEAGVRLAIKPAKGYSVTFNVAHLDGRPGIPIVDDSMHVGITPLGERLRVVGTAEFAGFSRTIERTRTDNLIRVLNEIYPEIAPRLDLASAVSWTGLRPMSADGPPYVGATKIVGLWVNTGHGHLGWTMAMGSARVLRDLIAGKYPEIDPAPYGVDR
jgi:D-amino-acid dehydrogenase